MCVEEDNDTFIEQDNDMLGMMEDTQFDDDEDDISRLLRDGEVDFTDIRMFEKLQKMHEDRTTPLWVKYTKLHTVLTLLQMKASNGWSDKSFTEFLGFLRDLLPEDNVLPENTYYAKKVICPLGLEVKKIRACRNNCILYRKEYAQLDACTVCKASRYKHVDEPCSESEGVKRKNKRSPAKVVWYFPIVPRLKHLIANKRHAQMMRWHAEEHNKEDELLRHPVDYVQWRNIDRKYKKRFASEVRNIRFGLSTDGVNPFGNMSNSHSTWSVTLCIFNLPSWLYMKRKYILMPLLIEGPKQPGNNIDVYLKPLIEELLMMWNDGVEVWNEDKRETFTLRAMLFVTIQDLPTVGSLSG